MKTVTLVAACLMAFSVNAQTLVDKYSTMTGPLTVRVTSQGDVLVDAFTFDARNPVCFFRLHADQVEPFRAALGNARDTYARWVATAKEKGITSASKLADVAFPSVDAMFYYGDGLHKGIDGKVTAMFAIVKGPLYTMTIGTAKLTALDNQYMKHDGLTIILSGVEQFDALIAALDPAKATAAVAAKQAKEDVFK